MLSQLGRATLQAIHTTGRFSTATGTSTIIVANRESSDSHANASQLCSSVGWHRNESLCTISKEKTRRALKILRFFRHFSTTRTYLDDNRERERGPIVSVGVDPTGTFWSRLATFHVYDQITIATRRQTSICPSCESPINRRFTRRADRRLPPGCYGNLIVNVETWSIAAKTCLWGRPRQTRLGHVHVHGYRRGTFLLYWNDERIVVLLKRVGFFLSISYKVTHFYASQPTSTIVRLLRVNPTTHDWLRLSWTCPWPSKICPSCESPIRAQKNAHG